MTSQVVLLVLLATLLSAFLALLFREEARARLSMLGRIWLGLAGGVVAVAWLLRLLAG